MEAAVAGQLLERLLGQLDEHRLVAELVAGAPAGTRWSAL